jgi:hypothetical protein
MNQQQHYINAEVACIPPRRETSLDSALVENTSYTARQAAEVEIISGLVCR